MLKRENEFEKDGKMKEINSKYNIEELFNSIVLEQEEKESEEEKQK